MQQITSDQWGTFSLQSEGLLGSVMLMTRELNKHIFN